jgi:transcriptional regulator with XRE-family HTH domain
VIGKDVKAWRHRTGYTQKELQLELGFKSRASVSSLENRVTRIDRSVELALAALEIAPLLRLHIGNERSSARSIAYPAIDEKEARDHYTQGSNDY